MFKFSLLLALFSIIFAFPVKEKQVPTQEVKDTEVSDEVSKPLETVENTSKLESTEATLLSDDAQIQPEVVTLKIGEVLDEVLIPFTEAIVQTFDEISYEKPELKAMYHGKNSQDAIKSVVEDALSDWENSKETLIFLAETFISNGICTILTPSLFPRITGNFIVKSFERKGLLTVEKGKELVQKFSDEVEEYASHEKETNIDTYLKACNESAKNTFSDYDSTYALEMVKISFKELSLMYKNICVKET